MLIEISSGENRLVIDPIFGGRVTQWFFRDLQILGSKGNHPLLGGWYLMAPWAGRIRDNKIIFRGNEFPQNINFQTFAIHGTVPFTEGKVQNQTETSVEIVHETSDPWPIKMQILQKWIITKNFVKSSAKISCAEGEFPAELGWHPWFKRQLARGEKARFGIEAVSQYVKDENQFTLSETKSIGIPPFDDAFHVPTGKGFIEWPQALRLDITSDVDTFIVYDELEDLFCIEPQTGPPDAVNHPKHLVDPQNPLEASVKWELISL
jgi:aldose 1-epimerase